LVSQDIWVEVYFKVVSHAPFKGVGLRHPQIFGTPYAHTVSPRGTKFGMETHVGERHVSRGSDVTPIPRGGVGPSPKNFSGTSNPCPHGMTNTNQNLHGDQIR